jgi:excinuclease UvrABC nuclease subunit
MTKKTVKFDSDGIQKLPNDKPVVYKILDNNSENIYTGIAKKGRVKERISEHFEGQSDEIPGEKVQIEQMPSIDEARKKENRIISRSMPKFNKR